jgi:broad specificity phosphatase PhoE
MGYLAALFAGGRVVTGKAHFEAFSQLSEPEQQDFTSGFLDPATGRFITDGDLQFYVKKIILIRHALACDYCDHCEKTYCPRRNSPDPDIAEFGRLQCERAANFLIRIMPVNQYVAYCCDCVRVQATAIAVCGQLGLPLHVSRRFCDPFQNESPQTFIDRLRSVIESLPEYSVIISHSDFVVNMAQIAMGTDITQCEQWKDKIPNCSITYVENHQPVLIGESPI